MTSRVQGDAREGARTRVSTTVLDAVPSFLARVEDLVDLVPFVVVYYVWWWRRWTFLVLCQWWDIRREF